MNLLMYYKNVNVDMFKTKDKVKSSFDILSQIMPPISAKFTNSQFDSSENKKKSNNIIDINNGAYLRGQMDKGVLGKQLIQSIFNDLGSSQSSTLSIIFKV